MLGDDTVNVSKEKIDEVYLSATENKLLDLTNQFLVEGSML